MSKIIVELELGALAPKISAQMKKQNINISADDLKRLQGYADSIVHLHIGGILSDSETDRARHRLFSKLKKSIK